MTHLRGDRRRGKAFFSCFIGIVMCCLINPATGAAVEKSAGDPQPPAKIHITARKLVFSQNKRFAEFQGDVQAAQGGTVIRSDTLQVHYRDGADFPSGGEKNNEDLIERIVASGNVSIKFETQTAFSEKAVYTPESGMLVLTGKKVRIEDKGNFINGEQILMNRKTGEITVIGGEGNRVEALFESKPENLKETTGESGNGDASDHDDTLSP